MFNSTELQNVYEELQEPLKRLSVTLDQMSQDINTFEDLLSSMHLLDDVKFLLRHHHKLDNPVKVDNGAYVNLYEYSCLLTREELHWDHNQKRLKFLRIERESKVELCSHEKLTTDEIVEFGFDNREKTSIHKPLIECTVDIRKYAYMNLGKFLKYITFQIEGPA